MFAWRWGILPAVKVATPGGGRCLVLGLWLRFTLLGGWRLLLLFILLCTTTGWCPLSVRISAPFKFPVGCRSSHRWRKVNRYIGCRSLDLFGSGHSIAFLTTILSKIPLMSVGNVVIHIVTCSKLLVMVIIRQLHKLYSQWPTIIVLIVLKLKIKVPRFMLKDS